jgi:hypothetical protein
MSEQSERMGTTVLADAKSTRETTVASHAKCGANVSIGMSPESIAHWFNRLAPAICVAIGAHFLVVGSLVRAVLSVAIGTIGFLANRDEDQ